MYKSVRLRTLFQGVLAALIVLPSLLTGAVSAHAAGNQPDVVINEIEYGGSVTDPADTYVELHNTTTSAIVLDGYTLWSTSAQLVNLHGTLPASGYFILSHNAAVNSSLVASDQVDAGLVISSTNAALVLRDSTGTVIDQANGSDGKALAGSGTGVIASEERLSTQFAYTHGTDAAAWFTAQTHGVGLKDSVKQYGTPDAGNLEVGAPVNLTISPASPTTNTLPTVFGMASTPSTMPSPATQAVVSFVPVEGGTAATTTGSVAINQFFATPLTPLVPGSYRVWVVLKDAAGNTSPSVEVQISNSAQNLYIIQANSTVVPKPQLDPTNPTLVNTPTVTLTGTVTQPGVALVFSVNGDNVGTSTLTSAQTTFSLTVQLDKDATNTIEVRAQNAAGDTSDPAIATVTQDSTAPAPLVTTLVHTVQSAAGVEDSISGDSGSAEPNGTVEFYTDAALTQLLVKGTVTATGGFGPLNIGAQKYPVVYGVVRDLAGNESAANARSFTNGVVFTAPISMTLTASGITQTQATIGWQAVPGAVTYLFKYRTGTGSYSALLDVCAGVSVCPTQRTLINLQASTTYTVAMAAVDRFGNVSNYTEQSFTTLAMAAVGGSSSGVITPIPTPTPTPVATSTPAPTPVPVAKKAVTQTTVIPAPVVTPTPTPTPTPTEAGQVQSAKTATTHNYTPWIILAILVALAILATAGYFYWFGGEEEGVAVETNQRPIPPLTDKTKETSMSAKKEDVEAPPKEKRPKDEKRW